jgi:RNA polymerase sigma factor (TIGR02999 family)
MNLDAGRSQGEALNPNAITMLLRALEDGEKEAADRLFEVVYQELRKIARRQLQGAPWGETLNTTALVHEAYLKLSRDSGWTVRDRFHFFALTARAMREVLIDHARTRMRQKRGGGVKALDLDDVQIPVAEKAEELVALDEALERLETVDPELSRLVEWRFFAGLTVEEIASTLEVSERTVKRHWRTARAFLYQELAAQGFAP